VTAVFTKVSVVTLIVVVEAVLVVQEIRVGRATYITFEDSCP